MANTFKNYTAQSVGNSLTTVYTAPTGKAVVIGWTLSNRTAASIKVSCAINDGADTYIMGGPTVATMGADIPPGGAMIIAGGDQKIVMETGDLLKVISSAASSVDSVVSVLEIT